MAELPYSAADHDRLLRYNRRAWDAAVASGSQWTIPVSPQVVEAARRGEWSIVLTPTKPVPAHWFPPLLNADVLCLASGGGQQGPVLAAAGARVVVFDNSPAQLAADAMVAAREGLAIRIVQGDMADLSALEDAYFDLIVHPCSNMFVPDVRPVWRECARVLRPGGVLLSGFVNPTLYLFDQFLADEGQLVVNHRLPYADIEHMPAADLQRLYDDEQPLEWSHTLEDQLGGQTDAGLLIAGFYEDRWPDNSVMDEYFGTFLATRAT
ncbi:MAG: class I SAM-dependent methyltransferase, partial [Caldilineaceae bacterium]